MSRHFPKYSPKKAKKPAVSEEPAWRRLILAHSPYLTANLAFSCAEPPDDAFAAVMAETQESADRAPDVPALMTALRHAKKKIATLTAIADLSGAWDDMTVTRNLSRFADLAVGAALRALLRAAHSAKTIRLPDPKNPENGCGVAVIALGKWGAFELNYSSDIDLMVLFDPRKSPVRDKAETQNFFIRLTRDLARLLDQPTEDGYVFRTDLRLRPDPGAMPLAVSIDTAETYYGSLGQNWERAAMIKSRPVAGDRGVGEDFMKIMNAWIWRKNLDFAAIQDIHSIKRQINAKQAHKGKAAAKGNPFLGFNVKLGHGGIREIEFFAQTQQLVYGGRELRLRRPDTLSALAALEETQHITPQVRSDLSASYLFLRRVEHRLQMQDDRQTHTLPSTAAAFADFTAFMEFSTPEKLVAALAKHTGAVKALYAKLFTESPSLAGPGNLVFTGVEDDPETLETLKKLGFREPSRVTSAIRGWHHGRYRAVRSERARQILTELIPHLLEKLGATPHPDEAFIRFDQFLSRLPSGIPIFSMFAKHPQQMELVAAVMGTSPALAGHLGTHPQVLEGVLSRDFFGRLPDLAWLKEDLSRLLSTARDYQDVLDLSRRWAREKRFHAGIHILKNLSDTPRCGLYLSDIAEASLACLIPEVEKEFAQAHGTFKTGEFIVIGMGSFAAQEMFVDSDLDIVGLYKAGAEKQSNGSKPLPPQVYYIRLMQRLIAALTAPTAEGVLYEVDARLRPAGTKGPIAAQWDGFFDYQRKDAWAWEHMALIRSRPVYATPETAKEFVKQAAAIIAMPRDEKKLRADMIDMRRRVDQQFGSKDPWNMKYRRGGIMDIMFAAHFLILKSAQGCLAQPSLDAATDGLLRKKLITKKDAVILQKAHRLAQSVQGFLRLSAELPFVPAKAAPGLQEALVRRADGKKKPFRQFTSALNKVFADSYATYKKIIE